MYKIVNKINVVRIPPDKLQEDYARTVRDLSQQTFEGKMDKNRNLIVSLLDVQPKGMGTRRHNMAAHSFNIHIHERLAPHLHYKRGPRGLEYCC